MWHVWGIKEVHERFWCGSVKERDHLEGKGIDGRIMLEVIQKKYNGRAWNGFVWLWIGTREHNVP